MSTQLTSDLANVAVTGMTVLAVLAGFKWCAAPAFRRGNGT